ncbi:ABC transporter substrate-binding protein [Azospirillum melinis]
MSKDIDKTGNETGDEPAAQGWSRRSVMKVAAGAMGTLAMPAIVRSARAAEVLYVNTWGGTWEKAAVKHLFEPFTKETGVEIRTVSPVSFAKLAAQVRTGVYEFDVTTLGGGDIVRANAAKIIDAVAGSPLAATGLWKDAVFENGIASHAFSTVIAYRTDRFPKGGPQTWADFWNRQEFPGTRCLQRYCARILPLALLADGVPQDKLYPLDTERAFHALERIKPDLRVWWTQGQQSQQLLRDGEVDMIGIWHSRALELIDQGHPVGISWKQAEIDRAYWVVSKDSPRREIAWKFIQSAVQPERLAGFCREALYGPLNPDAFGFIPKEEADRMPTGPRNYPLAFEQNVKDFGGNLQKVTQRFEQWLAS